MLLHCYLSTADENSHQRYLLTLHKATAERQSDEETEGILPHTNWLLTFVSGQKIVGECSATSPAESRWFVHRVSRVVVHAVRLEQHEEGAARRRALRTPSLPSPPASRPIQS